MPDKTVNPGRRATALGVAAFVVGAMAMGCQPANTTAAPRNPAPSMAAPAAPALTVTPNAGARNLPVSTEIGLAYSHGWVSRVRLTKAGSTRGVKGSMRTDLTSWVPDQPLDYSTSYTATITVTGNDGVRTQTRTTTFTTMARPGRVTGTGLYLFSGRTYGVGMPVVLEFDPPVADSARAGVQKRLFVQATPRSPGVWHWASGSQVWYRPPKYWRPGTTWTFARRWPACPWAAAHYGDTDRSATVQHRPQDHHGR